MTSALSHSARKSNGDAFDIVAEIVRRNRIIEYLTLVTYEENISWRDLSEAGGHPAVSLLLKGLQQDQGSRVLTKLSRAEISKINLCEVTRNLDQNKLLGVCSNVQLDNGQLAHIPMMDFICTPSTENLAQLARLIGNLRHGRGCLLYSGKSYHYYGFHLLSDEEWKIFLGKCLLMSGFVDDRYVGHQLIDGHCVLRLSSGNLKNCIPTVVAEVA